MIAETHLRVAAQRGRTTCLGSMTFMTALDLGCVKTRRLRYRLESDSLD